MDQELITYLDRHFRDTSMQIEAFRTETRQRFERVESSVESLRTEMARRLSQVDQRFSQIDQRFSQVDQRFGQIDQRLFQVEQRMAKVEETSRQTQIVVEGLRHELHLVAQGVFSAIEQMKKSSNEVFG